MFYYIIIIIIILILLLHGYNNVRYKFWMCQPLFYRYNLMNRFRLHRILSTERPSETVYLNFLSNIVTYITDTNIPIKIRNIYINETDRLSSYYENIILLMNKYPYFNRSLNNGNKKVMIIDRKTGIENLKHRLHNHDYNSVVTMNKKLIYKTDIESATILSVDTVLGVIISIPYYCCFDTTNGVNSGSSGISGNNITHFLPIYYSSLYYDPKELQDAQLIEMVQTHSYKIFDDWDEVVRCKTDVLYGGGDESKDDGTGLTGSEKGVKRQARENLFNSDKSKMKNKNITTKTSTKTTTNIYEDNGLIITEKKRRIYASIYKYTGTTLPKTVIPFVVYHRFYIPISSQPSQDWYRIEYRFHSSIQLIKIGTQNITLLYEFLESCYDGLDPTSNQSKIYKYRLPFVCAIIPSLRHIFHMIKLGLWSVYILLQKTTGGVVSGGETMNIIAMYIFSNSDDTTRDNNITYLTASVAYATAGIDAATTFVYGFINALKLENKRKTLGCIAIDTLSHNNRLIEYFLGSTKPLMVEKNTLLFHNYICNTLSPEHMMIMN